MSPEVQNRGSSGTKRGLANILQIFFQKNLILVLCRFDASVGTINSVIFQVSSYKSNRGQKYFRRINKKKNQF